MLQSIPNTVFNIKAHTFIKMNWTQLIGGAAMASFIREAFHFANRLRKERKKIPSNSIMKVTDIYASMKLALDNTTANRFTVERVEDSGGPLMPGADVFVSIINEDYQKPLKSIQDEFHRWRADKNYVEVLRSVCENGSAVVDVDQLPDDSLLKNIYRMQGIKYTEVYFIAQTKVKLFIATISTTDPTRFASDQDRTYIALAINELRNIFAEYYPK